MGIPYYFYVIAKTFDDILTDVIPECDNLMFDFNGLIHPSCHKYSKTPAKDFEKGLMTAIWNDTLEIIKRVKPQKSVHIYIDGVAPIAKMNQQRKRRFFKPHVEGQWDTNAISPATTFMTRLHASIKAHIRYSKDSFTYYFSGSDEVGEGEHKLMKNIVAGEKTLIYGMDADLIMLALFSHTKEIYLMRENYECLNIDALRKGILNELKNKYKWNIPKEVLDDPFDLLSKQIIESYGVVCFFLGNDFIPHPISISLKSGGLEDLMYYAGKLERFIITETEEIDWVILNELLSHLGKMENEKIFDIVSDHYNKKKEVETDPFEYNFLFKIDRKKWRMYYYRDLFYSDTTVILTACELYLKGFLWTYLYYKRKAKDNMWYYPYNYAPTMIDLHNYLNANTINTLQKEWEMKYPLDIFCDPIIQLLSILPRHSVGCIPEKYKKYMMDKRLDYLYPTSYKKQTFMKTKEWECCLVLPPMNIELIKSIIK
jgi:5'-3' exonuclease